MFLKSLLSGAFKSVVALRAFYALLLFSGTLAYILGFGNYIAIEENLGQALLHMPRWYFEVWGGFVALYCCAAISLFLYPRLALVFYVAAFAMDFTLSLIWFQQPAMDRAYSGSANVVEWTLNMIDLTIIAVLVLVPAGMWRARKTAFRDAPAS